MFLVRINNVFLYVCILICCAKTIRSQDISINLDSLAACDTIATIHYDISKTQCGESLAIPITLYAHDTTKLYRINYFLGNGDSAVSPMESGVAEVVIPSYGITQQQYKVSEGLWHTDCTKNRQLLYLRLEYEIATSRISGVENVVFYKIIKLVYHYK